MITRLIGALVACPGAWTDVERIVTADVRRVYLRGDTPEQQRDLVLWDLLTASVAAGEALTEPNIFARLIGLPNEGASAQVRELARAVLDEIHQWAEVCSRGDPEQNALDVASQITTIVTTRAMVTLSRELGDGRDDARSAKIDVARVAEQMTELAARGAPVPAARTRVTARRAWQETVRTRFDPEKPPRLFVPSGMPALDGWLRGGFGIGEETIIAAGTSVGKSLIAGMIARNTFAPLAIKQPASSNTTMLRARLGQPADHPSDVRVLVIGLEDPASLYLDRWMLDLLDTKNETIDVAEKRRELFRDRAWVAEQMSGMITSPDCPTEIVDSYILGGETGNGRLLATTVAYVREWARAKRAEAAERGESEPRLCVVFDYFQMLELPPEIAAKMPRYQQLAAINKRLTRLAKQDQIAVVVTAMLNGAMGVPAEEQEIREAKDIEHGADTVIKVDTLGKAKVAALLALDEKDDRSLLAVCTMSLAIVKGRTVGCDGQRILAHVDYQHQRICRLTDAQEMLAKALYDEPIRWARSRLAETAEGATPKKRRKKKGAPDDQEPEPDESFG